MLRMRQARDIWPWFLLVPYFAVLSFNVLPWFGEERKSANRTNAQGAIALIFASIVLPLLSLAGITRGWIGQHYAWLLALGLIVPVMIVVSLWLNPAREAEYHKVYRAMAPLRKTAFGLSTAAVAAVCLVLFFTK